jgi:hypothetical protein
MSKSEKYLQLQAELLPYKKLLSDAVEVILDQDITNYPIFIVHQQELEMGVPLVAKNEKNKWSVHASSLEEFVSKQIIFPEKIEEFKSNYKEPKVSLCIFVLSELGAQFVFIPR